MHGYDLKMIKIMGRWVTFFLVLWLTACSTVSTHRDGPPPFYVDVSKIPDAKPKLEPLARYGNMPSYCVKGNRYRVMKSAKRYHQRGIASWYGTLFHHQRTSSGECYNMLAMTAAHKSLPLPTYVQVTNLKNGRKVIVKVNDRGPFASNRIIDLSYVAAKKLGMLAKGTAYVDIKAIDPYEAHNHPYLLAQNKIKKNLLAMRRNTSHTPVYIQVGAFKNKAYAEKLKNKLNRLVSSPILITQNGQLSQKLYKVKIGPIRDVATADTIQKKLKAIGLTVKPLKV